MTSSLYCVGAALMFLAGCGESQSSLAPSTSAQSFHLAVSVGGVLLPTAANPARLARAAQGPPQIPAGKRRRTELFYYLSYLNDLTGGVGAWSVPHLKFVYAVKGGVSIPDGECSKTGAETFWVADSGRDELVEYDYGGKHPIKTLSTNGNEPTGCSVDPASGNIATAIISNDDVLVWLGGNGTPTTYTTPLSKNYFVGYDGSGNLFVDGFAGSVFRLAELPKSGNSFEPVTLDQSIEFPGNVQWDGAYLAIGDQETSVVYQFACSGTNCTTNGSTLLDGASDCVQFWIRKATLACGDAGNGDAALWHYPAGGSPYSVTHPAAAPLGSVIVAR
ncbi:MAG: hypothetical protein WAK11_12635 [Candidatus Cybelea sp.]